MKAFYIPIALLMFILLSSIASSYYIQQYTAEWTEILEQCESFLHEEQWERANDRLNAAYEDWDRHTAALHIILAHQDLEDAEQLFSAAFASCRDHNGPELRIHLRQLIAQLNFLAETQKANLKNIL